MQLPEKIKNLIAQLHDGSISSTDHKLLDDWVAENDDHMLAYEKEWERLNPTYKFSDN